MSTFTDPIADADEAREAIRGLAHATRSVADPTTIYPVLGSISAALASLTQSLHQLGDLHDGPSIRNAWINGDSRADAASSYRVAWELHRAAEMAHQVATAVDRAREIEATIAYESPAQQLEQSPHRPLPGRRTGEPVGSPGSVRDRGISL
ncbi:hypothetical protein [Nocardioides sp. YIM 152315]|uniref:hypothetical protein n=1 Tax=Nocardioides sp. YIM 152315 TaxID=3031760 RepID=UPI0023D9E68F|nr:hypothetical protein [Nocardioides sp. YIM 152315]MDF1605895.1 hypothetical protein [Nocardioides sp. YIM 152315]